MAKVKDSKSKKIAKSAPVAGKGAKPPAAPIDNEIPVSAKSEPRDDEVQNVFASQNHFQHFIWRSFVDIKEQLASINDNFGGFSQTMSNVQNQVNAIQAELGTIASDLEQEVTALQAAAAASQPPVDLSGLQAIVDRLNSDDAAWKQPAPAAPATPTA